MTVDTLFHVLIELLTPKQVSHLIIGTILVWIISFYHLLCTHRKKLQMCKHVKVYTKSLGKYGQLFSYTLQKWMYSLETKLLGLACYKDKDKFLQLMDFMHMDCHKKNCLVSYYVHANPK